MKNLFLDLIKFTDLNEQQWNQLSRFQKNLVVVVVFGGILLCGFLLYQRQLLKAYSLDVFSSEHVKSMKTNVVDTDKIQIVPIKVSLNAIYLLSHSLGFGDWLFVWFLSVHWLLSTLIAFARHLPYLSSHVYPNLTLIIFISCLSIITHSAPLCYILCV